MHILASKLTIKMEGIQEEWFVREIMGGSYGTILEVQTFKDDCELGRVILEQIKWKLGDCKVSYDDVNELNSIILQFLKQNTHTHL